MMAATKLLKVGITRIISVRASQLSVWLSVIPVIKYNTLAH
jgi:hypothetical protein